MEGATRALARFTAGLTFADLPEPVVAKARHLLLDYFGAALAGGRVPEAATITEMVRARGGVAEATVLGAGFATTLPDAAYANGAAADVLEHQDGYRFGGFHPSHALPALLAVAESRDADLGELLTAVVAAYEVANRIGRVMHPGATTAGWFPVAAGYGAAAGCAKLLGLGEDGIVSAIGAAGFFVPAVLIESIFAGFTVKPAFAGQIARAGVEGALHAHAGLTGWDELVEHPRGLVSLFRGDPADSRLTDGLGDEWTILEVHQKRFAGCRHTHGAAQACAELAAEHDLDPAEVTGVDVETYGVAKILVDRPAGRSVVPCTLSLPYVAAVALADRDVSAAQYAPGRTGDPVVHRVAAAVRIRVAPDLDERYPGHTATRVTVTTRDGSVYRKQVDLPSGDSRNPLTSEELIGKYRGSAVPVAGEHAADHAAELLLDATGIPVRTLVTTMTGGHPC
ncbi:MmgE/PrpD family protein [Herbidospora yilanensis]|uniref:MmgE/PrpD family protein n=1 Tax=Herbidospora yilanensis TaxID=354426 RepID=UPI0007850EBD|nr:MmgE/PrpD family protein [Herbidospora yilanensis]